MRFIRPMIETASALICSAAIGDKCVGTTKGQNAIESSIAEARANDAGLLSQSTVKMIPGHMKLSWRPVKELWDLTTQMWQSP